MPTFRKSILYEMYVYAKAGSRSCIREVDRKHWSLINQPRSGHSRPKWPWSTIDNPVQTCGTVNHYICICKKNKRQRNELDYSVEGILYRQGIACTSINIAILVCEVDEPQEVNVWRQFGQIVEDSGRFLQ